MSQIPGFPDDRPAQDPVPDSEQGADRGDTGRSASVTLRRASGRGATTSELMDQANRSLAEALRLTYSIVLAAGALLGLVYVFSGFRTVNEGEAGVKLLFGALASPTAGEPGITFTWPYPFGELVKIETGTVPVELDDAFWGKMMPGGSPGNPDRLAKQGQLDPIENGSVLTADQNLAHTYWTADYRRADPIEFASSIHPDDEDEIIEAVLQRGVVLSVAGETIEDLLRPTETSGSLESGVRRAAQEKLDQMGRASHDGPPAPTGLGYRRVALRAMEPPASLLQRCQAVQSARSEAARLRTDAQSNRSRSLNETAGRAGEPLLELIDEYERAIELDRPDLAAEVLAAIDDIFEGRATGPIAGEPYQADLIGGSVTEIISTARSERLDMRENAAADLQLFNAKLEQYRANPSLMIARDWARAYSEFLNNDFVSVMMLPAGRQAELRINDHPRAARAAELRMKRREATEAAIERELDRQRRRFSTDEGIEEAAPQNTPGGNR